MSQTKWILLYNLHFDCLQDLSDESFLRRHKKPEEDEKRRKRYVVVMGNN